MIVYHFKFDSIKNFTRKIYSDDNNEVCLLTMGVNSIVKEAKLITSDIGHILIGNYTTIEKDVEFVLDEDRLNRNVCNFDFKKGRNKSIYYKRQIVIGNDVKIGNNVRIIGGIVIGNGAIIRDGAVVYQDVLPFTEVVGNPGIVIGVRFNEQMIEQINKIKWWYWQKSKINEYIGYMSKPEAFIDRFFCELNPFILS